VAGFGFSADDCLGAHKHDVAPLATEIARAIQQHNPETSEVGWVMSDAEAIYQDFKRIPKTWKVTEFATHVVGEFVATFRVNGIRYVIEDAEGYNEPVRLTTWRQWQREAGNDD
jgi:hypothetical protein